MDYYNKIVINGVEYPLETVIVAGGAPTSSTVANVGQLYANTSRGYELYICTEKSNSSTSWQEIIHPLLSSEITAIVNTIS